MTIKEEIKNRYFDWMVDIVCGNRFSKRISFRKLLSRLHDISFAYVIPRDKHRYDNGITLRDKFFYAHPDLIIEETCLNGPCSVLEMMIALAIKCEERMDDPAKGDRRGQWFWGMISSLGLGDMTDDRFDSVYVDHTIDIFLNREYAPDGRGGLFTIPNCDKDLRDVEIWCQMHWYLNTILDF